MGFPATWSVSCMYKATIIKKMEVATTFWPSFNAHPKNTECRFIWLKTNKVNAQRAALENKFAKLLLFY